MLLAPACISTLGGCLVSGGSKQDVKGRYISPTTIGQLEPGVTTADNVRGLLGEPSSKVASSDGGEIWRWDYSKSTASAGTVLFLFSGADCKTDRVTTFAKVRDGVLVQLWQDASNDLPPKNAQSE